MSLKFAEHSLVPFKREDFDTLSHLTNKNMSYTLEIHQVMVES